MPPGSSRVKRHRRAEAAAVELGEQAASIRELDALAAQSNEDLFLVDRGGSKTARTKIAAKAGTSSVIQSATEKKLVQRIVKSIKAADGAVRGEQGSSSLSDLWGGDEEVAAPPKNTKAITTRVASEEKKTKTSKTSAKRDSAAVVSIAKARAGQSYHPEPSQHQAILAEALALELKRKEEEARKTGSVVATSSYAVAVVPPQHGEDGEDGQSSDEQSDSDEDSASDRDGEPSGVLKSGTSRRRKGKLTTAQRNRQRRVKQQSHEEQQARAAKRAEKDITRTDLFLKAIQEEHDRAQRNKELRELQAQAQVVDPAALHPDEVKAVPLSDELRGSLRRLTPRGGHIADRVEEMRRGGELSGRDRKRKRFERPHGARRVVWVPKYKAGASSA